MNADFYKLVRTLESLAEEKPESKKLENGKSVLKESSITEMDKSQPPSDRGGESFGDPYAKGGKAEPVKFKDMAKHAEKTLNKSMDKAHKKDVKEHQQGVAEGSLNENQEWDVYTVIQGKKADFKGSISAPDEKSAIQAVYKDPRTYGYVSRAYAWVPFVKPKGAPLPPDIGLIRDKIVNSNLPTNTKNMLTSMITGNYPGGKDSPEQYYKTGKFSPKVQQYIDKISQQGVAEGQLQELSSELAQRAANAANQRAYDIAQAQNAADQKADDIARQTGGIAVSAAKLLDPARSAYKAKQQKFTDYAKKAQEREAAKQAIDAAPMSAAMRRKLGLNNLSQQDVAEGSLEEVAPPGAKAERMVKHIKAGYAKDGDLTDKEKGIAYATAWKAHNKGKVEESQIDEGTGGSYYIVGIGRTAIKPVEVKTLSQAIADAKAMIARGQNVQVRQGSPIGAAMSLDMDTSTVPSREKDAERIAAYRNQRQEKIDNLMQARLNDMMRSAKTRDRLAKDAFARAEVDQLTMPLRANPTKDLAKKYDSGIKTQAPAKTWREIDKELMKDRTDKDYRRARAALRNPFGGLGVAEAKVKEAEVWRPGMPPPPNPDMGSSLTPKEQQRVTTPQGPGGAQQPILPSEPKKPAQPKRSDMGTDTDVAETAKAKDKKADRLPIYQESIRFKTINKLIREEFDLGNNNISLEEKDIKSALGDDLFNELQAVKNGESEMSEQLKDALFKYYQNTGELPPEVSRDEQDVTNYIKDRIMSMASDSDSEQPADRLPVSEDQKIKGTRYGGSAQVDDEETDDDTDTKKAVTAEPKRGRGRPRKDSGDANTKAKYSGASDLQSMIVGNVPKKSKDLGKLPITKHKLKGE